MNFNVIRWQWGIFWDENTCPKCRSKLKQSGFYRHNRRYTCAKCNFEGRA